MAQRHARDRVAGDHDHAAAFIEEPLDALLREVEHRVDVAPAVRRAAGIAEVNVVHRGQPPAQFAQHAEPAVAAVENADGM